MIAIRRMTFEVESERVVIAPVTTTQLRAFPSDADEETIHDYFCGFVEEPADFRERDLAFATAVVKAWHDQVMGLTVVMQSLIAPPNRAARRRMH